MKRFRSAGVEMMPPDAHAQPDAKISLRSLAVPSSFSSYPWMSGDGTSGPAGRLVRER
jgi:hypothetical protein